MLQSSAKCLECYQCTSEGNETSRYCDDYHWHTLTEEIKKNLVIGCPPETSSFCIKTETTVSGKRFTERGCINGKDYNGNNLIEGCIRIANKSSGEKTNMCFCSGMRCNISGEISQNTYWSVISPLLLSIFYFITAV